MAYTKYSLTPANNTATPPDGAPEGMLPSAVNDTMRDMMAQIRDCGDGIRDGTYTMTAPKITGGTITGSTINNSAIGGTTANSGAFTTLSASGVATFSAGTVSAPAITTTGDTNTGIFFPAADTIAFTEGGAEAMRIDSSGNVGIANNNPQAKLHVGSVTTAPGFGTVSEMVYITGTNQPEFLVRQTTASVVCSIAADANGGFVRVGTNHPLLFFTNNSERVRITSGGEVYINTTAAVVDANSKFVVSNKVASGVAAEFSNNVSGTACVLINNEGAATSTLINWYAANAFRSSVTWNGTNIIYGTPSDQRLKENIVDSSSALPLINDIKIRSFDWKENGNHIDFGVIAQELESVMPEAVLKGKDNEDGSIKESWSVDTSTLVPALIKAVQELTAKVAELEAKLK